MSSDLWYLPSGTDEGCKLSPSCLECPFEECRYDHPKLALVVFVRKYAPAGHPLREQLIPAPVVPEPDPDRLCPHFEECNAYLLPGQRYCDRHSLPYSRPCRYFSVCGNRVSSSADLCDMHKHREKLGIDPMQPRKSHKNADQQRKCVYWDVCGGTATPRSDMCRFHLDRAYRGIDPLTPIQRRR